MPFPPNPPTEDERRAEFLRLMSVGRYPGIYVLGSFARYVTVYAQQVRALNLVDALAKSGVLSRYSRVAVVGGGIAGLTAAAAAAVRGVGSAHVFEKLDNTMRLQRASDKRFLHPRIYDWPNLPGPDEAPDEADLPLMGWKADTAANVVGQLDAKWNELRRRLGDRLPEPRCNSEVVEVDVSTGRPFVKTEGGEAESFDVVILAVGFGLDPFEGINKGYWTDTQLDSFEIESEGTWFVSGYGDGALTDLMRLCILDFRHGDVIAEVDAAGQDVGGHLLKAERADRPPEELARTYIDVAARIADKLDAKLKARRLGKISLNCSEDDLFSPRSSVLNRLIVAYLLHKRRFELLGRGEIAEAKKTDGGYLIKFKGGAPPEMTFDNVIIRHGPDHALRKSFPKIWAAFQRQLGPEWGAARQHDDWTREPLYDEADFDPERRGPSLLRVDFGEKVGTLVIAGSRELRGLSHFSVVEQALELLARRRGSQAIAGLAIDTEPVLIAAKDAFSSLVAYERAVRALCESDITVFDITGREPAVMLLLGIRAAARRGVTVTLTSDNIESVPLPFNLASLNPINTEAETEHITEAIDSGLTALKAQPNAYLDLPVFDAVRRLGEDYLPLEPKSQILILRWFDPQYRKMVSRLLNPALRKTFDEKTSIVTTLDSRSPQLVEQRLYAAIRRTKLCIADWTGWRANVLFETGVRLAVNKSDPLFALCAACPPGWDAEKAEWPAEANPSAAALVEFFAPTQFGFAEGEYKGLLDRIETFEEGRPTGAKIPPGRTYQLVSETVERREEPGGRSVQDLLMLEALSIAGPAVPESGGLPVLFRETLTDQVRRAAVEYLLAAWFYLDGRHGLVEKFEQGLLLPSDPNLGKLRQIGQDLKDRLRNAPPGEFDEVGEKFRRDWMKLHPTPEADNG